MKEAMKENMEYLWETLRTSEVGSGELSKEYARQLSRS